MADTPDTERTESPTPKRQEDARKKGQVPRSRDLSAAAITLAAGIGLKFLGMPICTRLIRIMHDGLALSPGEALDEGQPTRLLGRETLAAAVAVGPLFALLLAAATLAPLALGGLTFSTSALALKWERLDPVAGLGRVFSLRGVIELLKMLARFAVVAVVAVLVLRHEFGEFSALGVEASRVAIAHSMALCGFALIALGGALALIALVDAPLAIWQHTRQLRMTRDEIRDEQKETEGSPESRGRVRRVQQAIARKRMMQQVPRADVVVTNPTHYAVALKYDENRMRAPIVVAKGADLVALRIRELAKEHSVPTLEVPVVARALFASCELGDEIPARLYAAVAQVLTYVYQLRAARRLGAPPPSLPSIDPPPAQ